MTQGFAHPVSDESTNQKARQAVATLAKLGIATEDVSIPCILRGRVCWTGIILEGAAEMMIKGYGMGNNWPGYYTTSLQEAFARGLRSRADDASETVKLVLLLGEYMHRNYHNRYHAKAQNLRVLLRAAYDEVLQRFDAIVMPTIPFPATELRGRGRATRTLRGTRAEHATEHLPI